MRRRINRLIISISKLLGNYNASLLILNLVIIISISKLLGNYNGLQRRVCVAVIISISKLLGNYNGTSHINKCVRLYQYLNC